MELDSLYMQEIFLMEDTWPHKSILEMRKEFVFCEMGGMPRPLLRSNWAAALITSDQEKERLLNETFNLFQSDEETAKMIEFIKPYVERAGLMNVETEVTGSKQSAAMRPGRRFVSKIFSMSSKYFLVKIITGTDSTDMIRDAVVDREQPGAVVGGGAEQED